MCLKPTNNNNCSNKRHVTPFGADLQTRQAMCKARKPQPTVREHATEAANNGYTSRSRTSATAATTAIPTMGSTTGH